MTRLLGFDPGLANGGLTVIDDYTRRIVWSEKVQTRSADSPEDRLQRLFWIATRVCEDHAVSAVVVENQRNVRGAKKGLTNHSALLARDAQVAVCCVGYALGLDVLAVEPGDVRRRLALPAGADKDAVWARCSAVLMGERPTTEHCRDAAAIAWAGSVGLRKPQLPAKRQRSPRGVTKRITRKT